MTGGPRAPAEHHADVGAQRLGYRRVFICVREVGGWAA